MWQKNVTKDNFWLGGAILKIRVPKQVPRKRKKILHFSQILIGPHFDLLSRAERSEARPHLCAELSVAKARLSVKFYLICADQKSK